MTATITAEAFRELWSSDAEFALIDPREPLDFGRAHLFAASNKPLSRLELMIGDGVPNRATRIVLCDDGDGSALRATAVLEVLGYTNACVLEGGLPAWQLAGGALFSGVNVPSKAFGEAVEHALGTPSITAADLQAKLASGEDFLFLDSRPTDEHADHCIPGSMSCPSAELILRTGGLEAYRDKDVVVHCAGRTRAIIGAQTLIDSGLFRSVRSLWNGTPAWGFERFGFAHGDRREAALPDAPPAASVEAARRIAEDWSIPALDPGALARWRDGPGTRYLVDVRSTAEHATGHLPGAMHVAGGQLVQTTDEHLVVQNAHVALIDSDGVRAVTTAMWLRRMGWRNVVTYRMTDDDAVVKTRAPHPVLSPDATVTLADAVDAHRSGSAIFCDLRSSPAYRAGHVPGAAFLTRARLDEDLAGLPGDGRLILVADDLAHAALVRADLARLGRAARVLDGGMAAWSAAGHPLETGLTRMLSRADDTYFQAGHFEDETAREREHRAYLNWEIALIDHLPGEPAARFELG